MIYAARETMINIDIQELFDGSLSDERTAELLHSLSVSPERRADFRRHMALQGAMQVDRLDSSLSSDEDNAIWGAITGLGAVASGAGSGYSFGWLAKGTLFLLMGIVGYLLGSNEYTNIFASGASSGPKPSAHVEARASLPHVVIIPIPLPSPAGAARTTAPAAAHSVASSASLLASSAPSSRASRRGEHASATSATLTVPMESPAHEINASSSNNGGATSVATSSSPMPTVTLGDTSNGDALKKNGTVSEPRTDTAAKQSAPQAVARMTPLGPDEVAKAMSSSQKEMPEPVASTRALALRTNGFEIAFGEHIGVLPNASQSGDGNSTFFNRHVDISYRIADGLFGFGARLGYGSFSLKSLQAGFLTDTDNAGHINRVSTVYHSKLQPNSMTMMEFYMNYRLPIGDRFALSAEGLVGGSIDHIRAGGNLSLLWMVTDRFGIQGGAGFSRYWYSLSQSELYKLLQEGGDGTSIGDDYTPFNRGPVFEGKYGVFYHF
jgi:hypothetical protein